MPVRAPLLSALAYTCAFTEILRPSPLVGNCWPFGCITPEQALASRTPDPAQPVVLDWGQPDPIDY